MSAVKLMHFLIPLNASILFARSLFFSTPTIFPVSSINGGDEAMMTMLDVGGYLSPRHSIGGAGDDIVETISSTNSDCGSTPAAMLETNDDGGDDDDDTDRVVGMQKWETAAAYIRRKTRERRARNRTVAIGGVGVAADEALVTACWQQPPQRSCFYNASYNEYSTLMPVILLSQNCWNSIL